MQKQQQQQQTKMNIRRPNPHHATTTTTSCKNSFGHLVVVFLFLSLCFQVETTLAKAIINDNADMMFNHELANPTGTHLELADDVRDPYEIELDLLADADSNQPKSDEDQRGHLENFFHSLVKKHSTATTANNDEMNMIDSLLTGSRVEGNIDNGDDEMLDMSNAESNLVFRRQSDAAVMTTMAASTPMPAVAMTTTTASAVRRRLTEDEKKIVQKVISENLINRLKQMYAITTRSRLGKRSLLEMSLLNAAAPHRYRRRQQPSTSSHDLTSSSNFVA